MARHLLVTLFILASSAGGAAAGAGTVFMTQGHIGLGVVDVAIGIATFIVAQIAYYKTDGFNVLVKDKERRGIN